jgi:hypothetical protein
MFFAGGAIVGERISLVGTTCGYQMRPRNDSYGRSSSRSVSILGRKVEACADPSSGRDARCRRSGRSAGAGMSGTEGYLVWSTPLLAPLFCGAFPTSLEPMWTFRPTRLHYVRHYVQ